MFNALLPSQVQNWSASSVNFRRESLKAFSNDWQSGLGFKSENLRCDLGFTATDSSGTSHTATAFHDK